MEDIPQPAPDPYDRGDVVRVYLDPSDPDSRFHDTRCAVVDWFIDDLDRETDRPLDRLTYRVRDVESGDVLPVDFRHSDLVPID